MPALSAHLKDFLARGVSIHLGGCDAAGRPASARCIALRLDGDDRLSVLVSTVSGARLLEAVAQTGRVAAVFCQPTTHQTYQFKGRDARVAPARPQEWHHRVAHKLAFADEIAVFGFSSAFTAAWFDAPAESLATVGWTVDGAWNQTPGPNAGTAVSLPGGPCA